MNKRIENLFEQALDAAVSETWTTLNPVQLMRLRDKFAELIVRECAWVADDLGVHLAGYQDKDGRDIAYSIRDNIREHFGVEE